MKKIDDVKIVSYIINGYVNERKSMNKLSKELKISDSTVKRILVENGIEIKKRNLSYAVNEEIFSEIKTDEDAYWLGFLYADGSVQKVGNGISLDLKEEDKYILEEFRNYCGLTKPLRKHTITKNGKNYISYCCDFSNEKIKNNLIKLGCVPSKSLILTCPTEEQVPQKFLISFIRGYCDGDGYVRWNNGESRHKEFCLLGTEQFLNGIVKRMKWENFAYIYKDNTSRIFKLSVYQKKHVYEILEQLYDTDLCLLRKKEIYLRAKEEMQPI